MGDESASEELHLTPRGWFRGAPPEDRVLSLGPDGEWPNEVWRHEDEALVRETLSKFGAVPERG